MLNTTKLVLAPIGLLAFLLGAHTTEPNAVPVQSFGVGSAASPIDFNAGFEVLGGSHVGANVVA